MSVKQAREEQEGQEEHSIGSGEIQQQPAEQQPAEQQPATNIKTEVLLDASAAVMAELDLCSLLEIIEDCAKNVVDGEYSTVLLHDAEFNELWSVEVQEENGLDERQAAQRSEDERRMNSLNTAMSLM